MTAGPESLLAFDRAVHPLEVEGEVVGVAFHCGMGGSTNWLHVGRDAQGRVVAVLADLDLLTRAELAPARMDHNECHSDCPWLETRFGMIAIADPRVLSTGSGLSPRVPGQTHGP